MLELMMQSIIFNFDSFVGGNQVVAVVVVVAVDLRVAVVEACNQVVPGAEDSQDNLDIDEGLHLLEVHREHHLKETAEDFALTVVDSIVASSIDSIACIAYNFVAVVVETFADCSIEMGQVVKH